jgi:asparagine synthase (glutamine-hydrolysing)
MCGILAILNNSYDKESVENSFQRGKNRGPEYSSIEFSPDSKTVLGFHRLAINGYDDEKSNQPLKLNDCSLICNGEIYNFKQLYKMCPHFKQKTKSDCEIIIHMYSKYGIKHTLQHIDGVFAFVLIDHKKNVVYVARDTYGVRPLFLFDNSLNDDKTIFFSSELKSMVKLFDKQKNIIQFPSGYCYKYRFDNKNNIYTFQNSYLFSSPNSHTLNHSFDEDDWKLLIFNALDNAVKKRVMGTTEREIACLLSGGLDSSLISALVNKYYKKLTGKSVNTWSIGFKGSEDLKYAQLVANHIDSNHHSIVVEPDIFLSAIERVIYDIESYDTTTVRASVGNWLISKYIKENSKAKVVFNGDGSDELTGGYLYFHYIRDPLLFDKECRRLLTDISYFDVLRSDRSISSHGLEARTPFLDKQFVDLYLSIPPQKRCHTTQGFCEKYLLRSACDNKLIPDSVLWRTKEAFSDGVSKTNDSWSDIIKRHVKEKIFNNEDYPDNDQEIIDALVKDKNITHNVPTTLEQLYYRLIYEKYYGNVNSKIIPYYWMPRYVKATDASARSLNIYKIRNNKNIKKD